MNFLVDAQLPRELAAWLRTKGHQASHVADLSMTAAADQQIASHIAEVGMIIVSKDADFLALSTSGRFAFVWLQCGNIRNRALLIWLEPQWAGIEAALLAGERLIEVR